jgi:hypothetical protein
MTDLITSVSLQPPMGGGMKGTTTTPLIAPVSLQSQKLTMTIFMGDMYCRQYTKIHLTCLYCSLKQPGS